MRLEAVEWFVPSYETDIIVEDRVYFMACNDAHQDLWRLPLLWLHPINVKSIVYGTMDADRWLVVLDYGSME